MTNYSWVYVALDHSALYPGKVVERSQGYKSEHLSLLLPIFTALDLRLSVTEGYCM